RGASRFRRPNPGRRRRPGSTAAGAVPRDAARHDFPAPDPRVALPSPDDVLDREMASNRCAAASTVHELTAVWMQHLSCHVGGILVIMSASLEATDTSPLRASASSAIPRTSMRRARADAGGGGAGAGVRRRNLG